MHLCSFSVQCSYCLWCDFNMGGVEWFEQLGIWTQPDGTCSDIIVFGDMAETLVTETLEEVGAWL